MCFKWKYVIISRHFPTHLAAWVGIALPPSDCAELTAFAGHRVIVLTSVKRKETTTFPVLELHPELDLKFK